MASFNFHGGYSKCNYRRRLAEGRGCLSSSWPVDLMLDSCAAGSGGKSFKIERFRK